MDRSFMQQALKLAQKAYTQNEVPIGAILVAGQEIIGQGWNQPIATHDPTAHAEIIALRKGAKKLKNYRLSNCTMYVTVEPCSMCLGALMHARIKRLVFATREPRAGAVISQTQLGLVKSFNHTIIIQEGILKQECSDLIKRFFQEKRRLQGSLKTL